MTDTVQEIRDIFEGVAMRLCEAHGIEEWFTWTTPERAQLLMWLDRERTRLNACLEKLGKSDD
jgi:hypothetical protein